MVKIKNAKPKKKVIRRKLLPVTILSGFLGSGKTTLLKHILQSNKHGLKIAIIVNDMAEVNIDGAHVARVSETHDKGNLVQMQNGCICCTLRGDFLVELANIAWANKFDYVLIESSGISEPQQVAETFTAALSAEMVDIPEEIQSEDREIIEKIAREGGLEKIAKVDTMVTVVDAFRFFHEFNTSEFLTDRFGREEVPQEDERTISDLMADQIEFANVIVINKIDMVDRNTRERVTNIVKTLNPKAKILEARHAKIEPREIVGTGMFNLEEAQVMSGWLRSLHEMSIIDVNGKKKKAPKPETLEYGINNFVYRARKPFDPLKLYKLLAGKFVLIQPGDDDEEEEEEEEDEGEVEMGEDQEDMDMEDGDSTASGTSAAPGALERKDTKGEDLADRKEQEMDEFLKSIPTDPKEIVANKAKDPLLAKMHRSKGWLWFATRPRQAGSWNTAGAMLRVEYEQDWYCEMDDEDWGATEDLKALIESDMVEPWGDRRQEIVFIGEGLDQRGITEMLDACLISDKEMEKWEEVMSHKIWSREKKEDVLQELWDDSYWAEWDVPEDDEDEEMSEKLEHHHKHSHHHHKH